MWCLIQTLGIFKDEVTTFEAIFAILYIFLAFLVVVALFFLCLDFLTGGKR